MVARPLSHEGARLSPRSQAPPALVQDIFYPGFGATPSGTGRPDSYYDIHYIMTS